MDAYAHTERVKKTPAAQGPDPEAFVDVGVTASTIKRWANARVASSPRRSMDDDTKGGPFA